jgi:hypothetical protein
MRHYPFFFSFSICIIATRFSCNECHSVDFALASSMCKILELFHTLAKSSKAPFVRDDMKLLSSQEWAVIKKEVCSEHGRRAHQGMVRSMAKQMEEETGEMPSFKAAASKLGNIARRGAVCSVAKQMEEETGEMPSFKAAAFDLGNRARQGAICSVATQMEEETGGMPSFEAAASKLGSRGQQCKVHTVVMQMEEETGEMPSFEAAAFKMSSRGGQKNVGKPKGNAVWAKVVQISRSDEEIPGTDKCADTKSKIAAELCNQGMGVSYKTCLGPNYIPKWYKETEGNENKSTIIGANRKRWKLTILSAKPADVKKICEKV